MELRHLRYFTTVAKELHFGNAAKNLHIAQPALSHQIKQLEEEIGVKLLHRTQRKVELTEAGKVFLLRAKEILKNVTEACDEARSVSSGELGQIKIGFTGFVTYDILPSIIRNYQSEFPNVKLLLKHLTTTEQVKALNEGIIDIGILIPPIEERKLKLAFLREEDFVMALPREQFHDKEISGIKLIDLANERFIMPTRISGPGYYDLIISLCYHAGFSPNTVQEAQELQTIISLVASGLGVAIVPNSLRFADNENVLYVPIQDGGYRMKTALAWGEGQDSPAIEQFINFVRECNY
ncbi:LysR family transcriptional regulator [Halalkalibacter krulwichiae]|uniref:HTH-type transcriptional regulator BenM n=1 Tax=Halalkalibacter krulwichiae TaxID=199441 RepID=A0A1X9MI32_9BACI|nr:LysR family transcriptional regulator [Halalkalibacter krulwichiae]ARK32290.1 HTH-type transcriptional regulator BenM [Halalkalibacter krulwichiae]